MNTEHVKISSLSEDPANARKHPDRNIEQIKASLRRFGQQKPIVVDENDIVRAGNGTLVAARALGWETISIVRSNLPKTELTAYAIADNRTAELAEWDADILATTLADPEIGDVGFLEAEMTAMSQKATEAMESLELPEEKWLILITTNGEMQQAEWLDRLTAEGLECKALMG